MALEAAGDSRFRALITLRFADRHLRKVTADESGSAFRVVAQSRTTLQDIDVVIENLIFALEPIDCKVTQCERAQDHAGFLLAMQDDYWAQLGLRCGALVMLVGNTITTGASVWIASCSPVSCIEAIALKRAGNTCGVALSGGKDVLGPSFAP